MREHLAASGDLCPDGEKEQQGREQCHQAEVAHRGRRSEKIILMKLVERVLNHGAPGRSISNPERVPRE